MNALVALLHFCEAHGPSILYCTQTVHNTLEPQMSSTLDDMTLPSLRKPVNETPTILSLRKNSTGSLTANTSTTSKTGCPACVAQFPLINNGTTTTEASRLVTIDEDDPSIQYVGTTQWPQRQLRLYKAVRLACIRSLTAEFCQGRDGPVLFGDDEIGYVMSYVFKLKDSQARGDARFYSLIMLMTDRVYLASCWPFLVSAFRSMALNLQERANVVFQREKETRQKSFHYSSISNNSRRAPISSQDHRRRSSTALRSLVDLLGVTDIYAQMQAQFSYTLKLSARKRMEKLALGRSESSLYTKLASCNFQ